MAKRALVTFATGQYTELLDITRPTMERYAARHGYDFIDSLPPGIDCTRPPSWWRIPALQQFLKEYDAILWLGCDVVIVNGRDDIAAEIPPNVWQAMVIHSAPVGRVPNCDVWYVTPNILPYLSQAWEMTQYLNHAWWEQAAITDLMGYDPSRFPLERVRQSELYDHTHFLPLEWNSHETAHKSDSPRFAHATHGPFEWRRSVMTRYMDVAL